MNKCSVVAQAVHIGDSWAADIQGSINAGLAATIWVTRKHRARPKDQAPFPIYQVSHVTELPAVLEKIRQISHG